MMKVALSAQQLAEVFMEKRDSLPTFRKWAKMNL
jgi:hypothetical protein